MVFKISFLDFNLPFDPSILVPMNSHPLHVRRAVVDDLPALRSLWTVARLPAAELESRLTEFQVVENGGAFAGAVGFQVVRQHARFYAEDYADFSVADAARELFWERFQTLAASHGVFRVWTQETSPFWTRWGFQPANAETLVRLPDEWKSLAGSWLTLELKNEEVINAALKNQFAGFMDAEKKKTAQVAAQARKIRLFITLASFAVFFICLAVTIWMLWHRASAAR
jgi:N-acetylglutamate synthase-like GNAT family acetyltransferase